MKFDSIGIIEYLLWGFSCQKKDNIMGERRRDALRVNFAVAVLR